MKNIINIRILLLISSLLIFNYINAQQICSSSIEPLKPNTSDSIIVINSVLWAFGAGETCPNLSDFTFQKSDKTLYLGLYYDISGMWPQLGCTSTDTSYIGKLDSGKYIMYVHLNKIFDSDTTFSIHQDTLEFNVANTASIIDNNLKNLNIYPIPTNDLLFIEIPESIKVKSLILFNLQGKQIIKFDPELKKFKITGIDSGLYFLSILTNKGSVTKKVLVK